MAEFGLKYWAELRSKHKDVFWRVEISERGYAGAAEQMAFDGSSPLSITWERRGDEFFIPVKGSEATINIQCFENFHYLGLFTSDPRKFRVSIYRNTKLYWRGYVVADLYSENFTAPPYQVSIKAVDGFNLLSSLPFLDNSDKQFTGVRSAWELIAQCIDILELGVDIADWMDLYADGMDENRSPLQQVYVDMEQLYTLYTEPTYREVLELCMRPFAAQIFQSNGALHIRRTISLYNDTRPVSFYSIGSLFPVGWLVTASGETLTTHTGEPIITKATRERIDSMWDGHINVLGDDSILEISPALRKILIKVDNVLQENLLEKLKIYSIGSWSNANGALSITDSNKLLFSGNDDHQDKILKSTEVAVEQCRYKMILEWSLVAEYYKVVYGMGGGRPSEDFSINVEFAFTITNSSNKVYYLNKDGVWRNEEYYFAYNVKLNDTSTHKIELNGFSVSGQFSMLIKQTLGGWNTSVGIYTESCRFEQLSLKMDDIEKYKNALSTEVVVNLANNLDMSITLPVADIAQMTNNTLLYALYLLDSSGKPTKLWHNRGESSSKTLVQHIADCALRYHKTPARKIAAKMFTGKHIDMNSVVQDEKYLKTGFYVNSLELECLTDEYNAELVEIPNLLT